jgi:ribose transport system substrate-binding protein
MMNACRRALALLLVAALGLASCKRSPPNTEPTAETGGKPLRIAVVPKGTTHEFWKAVHAGAMRAAEESRRSGTPVEILWKGPLKEDDLKGQIDIVQTFVAQGVQGIVLAPLSDTALRGAVRSAVGAKIPVVIFDSALSGEGTSSFVATDNEQAGQLAGRRLADLVRGALDSSDRGPPPPAPDKSAPAVAMLRYLEGSASTAMREKGFLDGVVGASVVSSNQYGGATTESAFAVSESLLLAQKAAAGGLAGVFAPNESTTFGMLLALRKAGLAGKVRFVGFDASEKLLAALEEGHIDALVVQDPFGMGQKAVVTMVDVLRGKSVPARIDTGARVIDKQSLTKAETKAYLYPEAR